VLLEESLEAQLFNIIFNITSALTTQTGALIASGESFYTVTILPILTGIASGVGELVISVGFRSKTVSEILVGLKNLPKTIEEELTKQFIEFKDFLSDWKKELVKEIALEVSLNIVGESYYKWDSTSTYYPTLTFLFKETGVSQNKIPS